MDGRAPVRTPASRTAVAAALGAWAASLAVQRSLRRVRGASMEPTLRAGDLVAVVPLVGPRRGDVVLVRDPREPSRVTVKRVLGLPGERLRVRRGRVLVDGVAQAEPYAGGAGPDAELRVPPGHVAVLGDARHRSTDSRVFGPVPLELVDGLVVARVAPSPRLLAVRPTRIGTASAPVPDSA